MTKEGENDVFDELPSPEDFCLAVPLSDEFRYDKDRSNPFFAIEHFKGPLDCFCPGCNAHSVFNILREAKYNEHHHYRNYVFVLRFRCSRDESHQILFVFRSNDGVLQKIGQYPSIADFAATDLRKYRTVLGNEGSKELNRAVGLASHGVGVGAFVYLRRVFESQIEAAHKIAASGSVWDEESFLSSRMEEKILMLEPQLPEFLVKNRKMYGIMSVGVHKLTEAQCLEAYPIVWIGIELMLDEQLERLTRQKKIAEATKTISSLSQSLKESDET